MLRFDLASAADDPEIRRLLRENPMDGQVRVALEREPNCFLAASIEGDVQQTIVARDARGRVVGMGSRSVSTAFVNGQATRLGYLGQLRADRSVRGRPGALRAGYAKLRELHEAGPARFYVTTIVEDNCSARRVLEAGISGLPTYTPVERFVTLVLPVTRRRRLAARREIDRGRPQDLDDIVACLRRYGERRQFAPCWSREALVSPERTRGLRVEDFYVARRGGAVVGCLARWDQRAYKQSVIRGYDRRLTLLRPLINLARPWLAAPRMPPPGAPLRAAFLSHVAVEEGELCVLRDLVLAALDDAAGGPFDCLLLGLSARNPLLDVVRRCVPHREYGSLIYVVHWDDGVEAAHALDDRIAHLEAAIL